MYLGGLGGGGAFALTLLAAVPPSFKFSKFAPLPICKISVYSPAACIGSIESSLEVIDQNQSSIKISANYIVYSLVDLLALN